MSRSYLFFALALTLPLTAAAQDAAGAPAEPPPPAEPAPAATAPTASETAASSSGSWAASEPDPTPAPAEEAPSHGGAYEDPQETYYFLGAFYRHAWIPSWMTEVFVQKAPDVENPQFGLEFSVRKDRFEVIYSAYYADFSAYGPYLASGDTIDQTEMIDSNLWAAMAGVTFLWSSNFSDWFAIEGGLGLGIGYVGGNLWRSEAYPTTESTYGGWAVCNPPTAPNTPGSAQPGRPFDASRDTTLQTDADSCGPALTPGEISDADGQDGNHYGVKSRRWTNGGSVPNVWFRAAAQLSLRFKPAAHLVIRADGGFDLFSGFFAGGALQFGF